VGAAALRLAPLLLALAAGAAFAQTPSPPVAQQDPLSVAVTTLFPGGGTPPAPDPRIAIFEGNPQAIAEGKRYFDWYNCSGCHFHGAGGIGPAFMGNTPNTWRYGGRLDQLFASIYQGRPNGMPSWAGKIPDQQIWEIAAYVRSLSPAAPPPNPVTAPNPAEPPASLPQPPKPDNAPPAPTPPQGNAP
jgi:cytochrome c oxidase cbb3-type subunit 3